MLRTALTGLHRADAPDLVVKDQSWRRVYSRAGTDTGA
jgi:hypothetical protein